MRQLYMFTADLPRGEDGELPSEFRIFKHGSNPSMKGNVEFDEVSAELVMSKARTHDVDTMIDLEHYSVFPRLVDPDNSDQDARGWFRLELRSRELWAVRVSWTDDGARRLRARTQRYISPVFSVEIRPDGERRVTELFNVALCAQPAIDGIEPLVASRGVDSAAVARYRAVVQTRNRDTVAAALAALEEGNVDESKSLLAQALAEYDVAEGEGDPPEETTEENAEDPPPPEEEVATDDGADEMNEETRSLIAETRTGLTEIRELRTAICGLVGPNASLSDAVAEFRTVLKKNREQDAAERSRLVGELVQLRSETPSTAYVEGGALCDRLASEPIESLRARTVQLRTARANASGTPTPPSAGEFQGLSPADARRAESMTDPKARARFVEIRRAKASAARRGESPDAG